MVFGYKQKPNFSVENEAVIAKPPSVDFGGPTTTGALPAATAPAVAPAPPPH
jgi:LemA protein